MPNLAVVKGVCPLGVSFEPAFPLDRKTELLGILSKIGDPLELDEGQIDALTALSGSGIAFVWHILEGFIEAGVKLGLPFGFSRKVALETFLGACILAKEEGEVPIPVLKERVTTPKGTTIEGLFTLERLALKGIIIEAITKSYERAQALSAP
jgi:pyrroline-5-carboxylate reductase